MNMHSSHCVRAWSCGDRDGDGGEDQLRLLAADLRRREAEVELLHEELAQARRKRLGSFNADRVASAEGTHTAQRAPLHRNS